MRPLALTALSALLALPLLAGPAQAADDGGAGQASVGLVTINSDGDRTKFREDSLGERSGVFLDLLRWRREGETSTLRLDARFSTGRNGWLDLRVFGNRWDGGVRVTSITNWSNDSFAGDRLPTGTAVADLYPGSVGLDPLFGLDSPRTETLAGEAWATYRLAGPDRITIRAGARSRDGERVPNVGGFSFSDLGTASFTTAGLESVDSTASWLALEGRFTPGPFMVRARLGVRELDSDRTVRLPAYGADRLLDLNAFKDAADTRITSGTLDLRTGGNRLAVYSALAWSDVSSDPRGGDWRETADGTLVRGGLNLGGGSVDSNAFAAALGATWKPTSWATLTLALDSREADGDGDVDLFLRSTPIAPARTTFDEARVGGTLIAGVRYEGLAARLRARGSSTELDRREMRDTFLQDTTRTTDRVDTRLDASYRLSPAWSLSGWVRAQETEAEVDLADLWDGYATSDWETSTNSGSLAVAYRAGGARLSLGAAFADSEVELAAPSYDPIFDPSIDLTPAASDSSLRRLTGAVLVPLSQGSVWGEVGWLSLEYDLDEAAVPTGLLPLSEKIGGLVTVLGGETAAWTGARLSGQVEWIQDRDDLDNELLRAFVRLDQELTPRLSLFARLGRWQLDNAAAASDEYTVTVLAGGLRASF